MLSNYEHPLMTEKIGNLCCSARAYTASRPSSMMIRQDRFSTRTLSICMGSISDDIWTVSECRLDTPTDTSLVKTRLLV